MLLPDPLVESISFDSFPAFLVFFVGCLLCLLLIFLLQKLISLVFDEVSDSKVASQDLLRDEDFYVFYYVCLQQVNTGLVGGSVEEPIERLAGVGQVPDFARLEHMAIEQPN